MDPILNLRLLPVALFLFCALLYLNRIAPRRGGLYWAMSLGALFVGAVLLPRYPPIAHCFHVTFAVLFFAGALQHTERSPPRWAGLATAGLLLVVFLRSFYFPSLIRLPEIVLSPALLFASGWILWPLRKDRWAPIAWTLPAACIVLAGLELITIYYNRPHSGLVAIWVSLILLVAMVQLLSLLEGARTADQGRRVRLAEKAKLSEDRQRVILALIDAAPIGIVVVDENERLSLVNPRAREYLGLSDSDQLVGSSGEESARLLLRHCETPEEMERLIQAARGSGNATTVGQIEMRSPRGKRYLDVALVPVFARDGGRIARMSILYDNTERIELESRLRQSSKMETVGTFAGGLAHDFNNQLTVVAANLELALATEPDDPVVQLLRAAQSATAHCSKMTAELLSFSRVRKSEFEPVELTELLQETQRFLASTLPTSVELQVSMRRDIPTIQGDRTQLQQVLLNLAINASDAMQGKGTLALGLDLIEETTQSTAGGRSTRHVLLTVEDDGPGVPVEIRSRIFEPFFTTKEPGKGTGLGLAAVHGVVKAHGGELDIDDSASGGARFTMVLPCNAPSTEAPKLVGTRPEIDAGAKLTILVADDETAIRDVLRLWLTSKGHEVVEAADGLEAIEEYKRNRGEIDLLILDLTMPRLDGARALRTMRELGTVVPTILASGNLSRADIPIPGDVALIAKPYSFDDIDKAMRRLTTNKDQQAAIDSIGGPTTVD